MYDGVHSGDFSRLDFMHHLLAGLKAHISDFSSAAVDKARRACGGAGYASGSGFTELSSQLSPIPTFEGDNTVMMLQASRYIFKLIKRVDKGQKIPYPFEYIQDAKRLYAIKNAG
jgi:hypothetical protein